jgi:hypothetical protein
MASDDKIRRARLMLAGFGVLAAGGLIGAGVMTATYLGGEDDGKPAARTTVAPTRSAPRASHDPRQDTMTPEQAPKLKLEVPTGQRDGLSTGFSNGPVGAISKAVYFWEEYAFLDDHKARQQLEAITSPDAEGYVDKMISEVRSVREGAGLPPSGGVPSGITFSASVNAVRATSMDTTGLVMQIWMNYDLYATLPDGRPSGEPYKDQDKDLILKLQDGSWKLTNEAKYWKKRNFPVAYFPDSNVSWKDNWQQVRHAD